MDLFAVRKADGPKMRWYICIEFLFLCVVLALPCRALAEPSSPVRKIPVLVYHSHRILGNTYETNDHEALLNDLRTIHAQGFHIVPLSWVVEWVLGRREEALLHKAVAISFDDGADFDYYDIIHPRYGPQRSFYNILRDFRAAVGLSAQPHLHASSFIIASPAARRDIDMQDYAGSNWMTEAWWKEANNSGIISIYSHSWDHNHPDTGRVCEENQRKGSFAVIDTYAECQCEVQQAGEYIHQKIDPAWPELFAYPWGQSSEYLRRTFFPTQQRTTAAFGASGGYVTKMSPRWDLPRFVSAAPWPAGWRSTEELVHILQGSAVNVTLAARSKRKENRGWKKRE